MTMDMDTLKMSYEEMIDTLKGLVFGTFDRTTAKEREALDMAIKALQTDPSADVIPIPDGATNGEMIKAMFPNEEIIESDYACVYVGAKMRFDKDWWNASYKTEKMLRELPANVIELEPIAKEFDEFVQTKPNTKNVDKWCSMKMREILCDYFAKKCLEEIGEANE